MQGARAIRRLQIAFAIFAAWSVFGFLLGQQVYALRSGNTLTWQHALIFELAYCYAWAALTPLVLRLRKQWPVDSTHWKTSLPIHLAASVLVAALAKVADVYLLVSLRRPWFPPPDRATLLYSIYGTLDYGAVLYCVVLLVAQTFAYFRQHTVDQLQKSELKAQLAEAQLKTLRMQMHPHFLFNALNSVSALIHDNPLAADRLLARLSELLRTFLQSSEVAEVRLDREIQFLNLYLEIQKIRFEERLSVEIEIDPRIRDASVPSLILQPLVENAIRHGISEREDAGSIHIQASVLKGWLKLRVADSGDGRIGVERSFEPEGTGIRNTRRRLETIYGSEYQFRVGNLAAGGVEAVISIPYRAVLP